jgi:hypothetical protein
MKEKHQEEIKRFPLFFAFSVEQFNEGMKKFGLQSTDTAKICKIGMGGFCKRKDASRFRKMLNRHERKYQAAIARDRTGEGFIFDMFFYELGNHEYCYTNDIRDTLESLGLTENKVNASEKLKHGLLKAIDAREEADFEV